MIRLLPLLALFACQKDPVWFGYWEIVEAERDGVKQPDMGVLEVFRDSKMAMLLRYEWTGSDWVPDPAPHAEFGETNAREQDDIIEAYKQEGEIYTVYMSPFCTDYQNDLKVESYQANRAILTGKAQPWPGAPLDELLSIELTLQR